VIERATRFEASAKAPAIQAERFSYQLLVPRASLCADGARWDDVYDCWQTVWGQTLRELDGADMVFSDDFTRQHELGCLFYSGRCIGMTAWRWVDLSIRAEREDSYFRAWPRAVLESAFASGKRVCIGSNLTVLPEWRGMVDGYSIKELLMVLAVKRFLASDADVMVGTMRNDRGMNGLVYRLGARPLLQSVAHHGVAVDLVTFTRGALGPFEPSPQVNELARRLWGEADAEKPLPGRRDEDGTR
jgi:hypothetical protein